MQLAVQFTHRNQTLHVSRAACPHAHPSRIRCFSSPSADRATRRACLVAGGSQSYVCSEWLFG